MPLAVPIDLRRGATAVIGALALLLTTLSLLRPAPADADAAPITLSAAEVNEALFVAGDIARLGADPSAGVLEGVLQELYAVRPGIASAIAVEQIRLLESGMAAAASRAPAEQQLSARSEGAATYEYCQHWSEPAAGAEWSKRDHICADWTHTNAARLHFLTSAVEEPAVLPETRRAVRKQVKTELATPDNGVGASVMTPTLDQGTDANSLEQSADRLQRSYAMAQDSDEFAVARDDLWAGTSAEEILASLQQRQHDPDLAPLAEQMARISSQGVLTLTAPQSEDLAAEALSRTDAATGTAVDALTQLAQAQQKYDDAKTDAARAAAKKELDDAKDGLKEPLEQATKIVKDAKTVVDFATFILKKVDPDAAEAIQGAADAVLPVAEGLIEVGSSIVNGVINFYSGNWIGLIGNAFSALQGLEKLFGGTGSEPKPDPVKVALENLGKQLEKLGEQMHERFDRIDAALEQIYTALTTGVGEVLAKLVANERNVAEIFDRLEAQRANLVRLEDRVFALFNADQRRAQMEAINLAVGKRTMSQDLYDVSTNAFYTWATVNAKDDIALGADRSFAPADRLDELNKGLDTNVDYLRRFPQAVFGLAPLGTSTVVNPSDWGSAARAFTRVITEHPRHFHSDPRNLARLDAIVTEGERLRDTLAVIAGNDTTAGTGSTVLNAATQGYRDAWGALSTGVEDALDDWIAGQVTSFDLWAGPRQPYTAADLPSLPAISCGPVASLSGKAFPAGAPYANATMPNQLGMALTAGLLSLRVCSSAVEWVNIEDRPETNPRTPIFLNRFAQLRVRVQVEARDAGGRVATATGTYTAPDKTLICSFDEDGTDNCDLTANQATAKAAHQWDEIRTKIGYTWDAQVRDQDESAITGMVTDWLRGRQQGAVGHLLALLSPGSANPTLSAKSLQVSAARKALSSYVELGLPAGLAVDAELRGLLEGGLGTASTSTDPLGRLLDGTTRLLDDAGVGHLSRIWGAVDEQYRSHDVPAALRTAGDQRLDRLEQLLREHVVPADGQTRLPLGAAFIESTLDRLALARSTLTGAGPVTTIVSGPTSTASTRPTFAFTTGEEELGTTVACRVFAHGTSAPDFGPCSAGPGGTSHTPSATLTDGDYVFEVRGVDDALIAGTPASRRFTVATGATPGGPGTPADPGTTGPGSAGPSATALTMLDKPRVKGKAIVGRKLKATTGAWSPGPTTVRYQWLRDGKVIKGRAGTRPGYRIRAVDRGRRLKVRITALLPGHSSTTVTTKAVRVRR
ncbi:hypothetical protein [Nocardioides sp. L-11A]|uniref:hypothetical protein n=1 Tax=Nocardioides sp. L-11A TaxID=3043848 RepID=UPI00249C879A|nr:hypothetical protein QJ852_08220 [Nocardioides sp. L-11A]